MIRRWLDKGLEAKPVSVNLSRSNLYSPRILNDIMACVERYSVPHDLIEFESTESAYDLKEMHRIVNALPREYKVPFSMHVSGFKYREIAEKLGLPLGTVKSRIFFTRQKLQQELKDFV